MEVEENGIPETRFNSPMPAILQLRKWIFGSRNPGIYTQVTFFLNLILWFIFFSWSVAGYVAVSFREFIFEEKQVPVEQIIELRGTELGFEPGVFIQRLDWYQASSISCWFLVFVGLVLLWRRKKLFVWFFFGGTVLNSLLMLILLNFDYAMQDTTTFDKLSFTIMNVNVLVYAILLYHSSIPGESVTEDHFLNEIPARGE